LKLNPNVQVLMGETGWPSQGISFNDLTGKTNTVANEKAYLAAFTTWANTNKVESYPFEAIDEPWKSNQNQPLNAPEPWKGPNGAEGHYGVWTYNASNDSGKFVAKWKLT
jgi:exo-beta-1,3-glucanase (GH17 family)